MNRYPIGHVFRQKGQAAWHALAPRVPLLRVAPLMLLWLIVAAQPASAQTTLLVDGANGSNNAPIQSITYTINSSSVPQTVSATTNQVMSVPVFATEITIDTGSGSQTQLFFNDIAAQVRNNNFLSTTGTGGTAGGVGVYDTSAPVKVRIQDEGLAAYEAAVVDASLNNNILNYLFYDGGLNDLPDSNTADFDLVFYHAWTTEDYLVVGERDGNTFFELVPLGPDGKAIPGANTLRFADSVGGTGTGHQWNSGYINDNDEFDTQAMWFTVASIAKFFEGTSVPAQDQLVYGYRIDNNGNADVKFFGASVNDFEDNPENPLFLPGSIGDFVWFDSDGDGIQDSGEGGVNGVTVNLLDSSGNPVLDDQNNPITTVTANDGSGDPGFYQFTDVLAGDYIVEFVLPAGRAFSLKDQGGDDALDSDANPATGRTDVFTLGLGEAITNIDAGLIDAAALQITKTSNAAGSVSPGDMLTYTIEVENVSAGTVSAVDLVDTLPGQVTFVADTVSASLFPVPGVAGTFTEEFTTAGSGTFTVPAGVTELKIEAWGGGGSGAASGTNDAGGAGGGGAYARLNVLSVTPGDTFDYSVGAGGGLPGAGNPGNPGQSSWFSSNLTLLAQGGGAGGIGTISAGGAGGSAATSTGDQKFAGGNGGAGYTSAVPDERGGGGGGGSAFANAPGGSGGNGARNDPGDGGIGEGNGGNGGISTTTTAGSGFAPGGGGGGCSGAGAGAGAPGKIIVTYDVPAVAGTTGAPPNLASDWTLEPGATLTVTLQVTVNQNPGGGDVINTASVTSDANPEPLSDSVTDPLDPPTAVVLGDIELLETGVSDFLRGLGVDGLDSAGLLVFLGAWDPAAAEWLAGADRTALLEALRGHLDPDGDDRVAVMRWETLEEQGTVGFYVEREQAGEWTRVNARLLPAMVAAPMGAEYLLADPAAQSGESYQYRLIELEARGNTREYGPFDLSLGGR